MVQMVDGRHHEHEWNEKGEVSLGDDVEVYLEGVKVKTISGADRSQTRDLVAATLRALRNLHGLHRHPSRAVWLASKTH